MTPLLHSLPPNDSDINSHTDRDSKQVIWMLGKALDHGYGSYSPIAWGVTQEEPGKFLLVVGWDSVQINCVVLL